LAYKGAGTESQVKGKEERRDNETRLEFVGRGKMKIYGWEEVKMASIGYTVL
jgi:hypothetical protein